MIKVKQKIWPIARKKSVIKFILPWAWWMLKFNLLCVIQQNIFGWSISH